MPRTVARAEPRRRLTWPPGSPQVGIHLGVAGGLLKAARRARQIGATALQIFSDNPTAWRRRSEPPPDAARFVAYCAAEGINPVAIHASYLINLAGIAEPFAGQSLAGLIHEVQRAPAYGASLVNTHIGSHRGEGPEAGLRLISARVASVLAETPPGVRLVLENSSGGGDSLGSTLEDLARILDAVPGATGSLVFCLDTAHLWGAGYDMTSAANSRRLVDEFDRTVGIDRLQLIHLNDSPLELGAKRDKHEHLGRGLIPLAGLEAIVRHPKLRSVAMIMETAGSTEPSDEKRMDDLRALAGVEKP